jgi:cell division protein FtsA
MILTGGTSLLPGIQELASRIMEVPVRIAQAENIYGLADQLYSPAYASSIGLLHWAMLYLEAEFNRRPDTSNRGPRQSSRNEPQRNMWETLKEILKQLLP